MFWPLIGSFDEFFGGLFCCRVIACTRCASRMPRSFSENVTELNTELVLVDEASEAFLGLECLSRFFVVCVAIVVAVWNVEIELVERRSSWIFAIISAGVVALDMSNSTLVSRKIRSMSKVRIFAISWLAFVTMQRVVASHQASFECSIMPSVKNLWNLSVLIVSHHRPVRKTSRPPTTLHAC